MREPCLNCLHFHMQTPQWSPKVLLRSKLQDTSSGLASHSTVLPGQRAGQEYRSQAGKG